MKVINKKGFTLVELLAIIVVLAIIALLAVQAVLPTLDKAKKQLFALEAQRAIDAAQSYFLTKSVTGEEGLPTTTTGEPKCVTIGTLISDGFFETKGGSYTGYVQVKKGSDNSYIYRVSMTNGNYNVDKAGATGATGTDDFSQYEAIDASKVSGGQGSIEVPADCIGSTSNNENPGGQGYN